MTLPIGPEMIKTLGPARIINLTERHDRRAEMAREMASIGLHEGGGAFVFLTASRPQARGDFPTLGTRGCFESHLQVIRQIAEGPDPSGLLLEDDCDFTAHLADGIASLAGHDWDIFYGFYDSQNPAGARAPPGPIAIGPDEPLTCAHFMAIRRDTAIAMVPVLQAILSRPAGHPDGGAMHVDGAYNWFRRLHPDTRVLAANPAIARQRPSQSNIHPPRWWEGIGPMAAVLTLFRQARRWSQRPKR